ncbi:MAG: ADP-ribose pyrophosphatase, partial [Proteobacteria bacterium]|nr:ADP-ribose pyrophosphatase [Pseudomonadota bacterium]
MNYRTTSVRAIIKDHQKLLVEWFAPKQIAFLPGGTVEAGENLQAALMREL